MGIVVIAAPARHRLARRRRRMSGEVMIASGTVSTPSPLLRMAHTAWTGRPVIARAPCVVPWYAIAREMTLCLVGFPCSFQ